MLPVCVLAIEDESDRAFMTMVFNQYQWLMFSTAEQVVKDRWAAEDVVQGTVEKLIDKIDKLKGMDERHMVNYIITACRHAAYNELRYRSRHPMFTIDEDWDTESDDHAVRSMETRLIHEEDLRRMADVWPELDERSRYVLEARYILEMTDAEIAKALDVKAASVRMALTRARKKALELIEKT